MKKLLFLIPLAISLVGCVFQSPEMQAMNQRLQQGFENSGLNGRYFTDSDIVRLKNGTNLRCPFGFIINQKTGYVEGLSTLHERDLAICKEFIENLEFYFEKHEIKADVEARQKEFEYQQQRALEQEKRLKEDKAQAQKLIQQANRTNTYEKISLLEEAANLGSAKACYMLAQAYERGNIVDRDPDLAYGYYVRASSDGHPQALMKIGDIKARSGTYNFTDNITAYSFYKAAAYQGAKGAAQKAKNIEQRFKARIAKGDPDASYFWDIAQSNAQDQINEIKNSSLGY